MFVIALALVLASNGPVCKKFCDTGTYVEKIAECEALNGKQAKDIAYCKQAFRNLLEEAQEANGALAEKNLQCEKDLAAAKGKQCKPKRPAKKKAVVVVVEPRPQYPSLPPHADMNQFEQQDQGQHQEQTVIVNVQAAQIQAPPALFMSETSDPFPWLGLGVRGAGGTAFCAPAGIGLLGLRLNLLKVHLGLDVYTQFYWGTGAQLLLYPIQTRSVMWHINGGVIGFNQRPYVTPDLPRQLDMTLGTGLEFRVLPFLWVTADLQARMANPVAIAQTGRQFSDVLGKSLLQTQGMLGLMLRTW